MKSDTEKVLAVLVKKGVYKSAQDALLRDRRWLTWGVPAYSYWYGATAETRRKLRYCWTNICVAPGHYLIWNERVVRSKGPNKRVVRSKFDTCISKVMAKEKAQQRRDKSRYL